MAGGVFPSYDCPSAAISSDDTQLHDASGYTQTNLVAETMVKQCIRSGIFGTQKRIRIVKPGYIVGSKNNGFANRRDFIWRLIAGCVEIGAYNRDDAANWLCVADVETVAMKVVAGVLGGEGEEGGERNDGMKSTGGGGGGRRRNKRCNYKGD